MTNNDFCKKNILQYLGNDHPELIFFDSIDSTNNYAKELIAKNQTVDGMCICADEQTAGRGRSRADHSSLLLIQEYILH